MVKKIIEVFKWILEGTVNLYSGAYGAENMEGVSMLQTFIGGAIGSAIMIGVLLLILYILGMIVCFLRPFVERIVLHMKRK